MRDMLVKILSAIESLLPDEPEESVSDTRSKKTAKSKKGSESK